MDVVSLFVALL